MSNKISIHLGVHRIGAVSELSGVPVPTLRGWELRHGAFMPSKSNGQHRLYSDDDLLRASLLKRLTDAGHAISGIARMGVSELNQLVLRQQAQTPSATPTRLQLQLVNVAVVDLILAGRIESKAFALYFLHNSFQVNDIFSHLAEALKADIHKLPELLLVKVNSLDALVQLDLHELLQKCKHPKLIVIYNFGQANIVATLKRSGVIVRRAPLSDSELADLMSSVFWVDNSRAASGVSASAMIPPRKYNDKTLARVAGISSSVLCECPRHVAEIIAQLASFEQYSQDCLNKSNEDAHLHAYLSAVSGSARALFEQALETVAAHENIDLTH
jgi:MerR family transcriptional regulator, light-induced transcriptional regulator